MVKAIVLVTAGKLPPGAVRGVLDSELPAEEVFVEEAKAEDASPVKPSCPNCGEFLESSEGCKGSCPNCGYAL